ncbi:hypothetical protein HYE68_001432 [Fusarium pseudograminearum]|nr:hypothetical protein HYE68_001432 [Fusarium pseudograminearum]
MSINDLQERMDEHKIYVQKESGIICRTHPSPERALANSAYSQIDQFQYTVQKSPVSTPFDKQESLVWLRLTRRMLTDLIMCLDTTIRCWDNYDKDQFPTEYGQRCLRCIQQNFLAVKNCLTELKNIRALCDDHKEAVLQPITVAATMLSMHEKAIPPALGPTKVSFFILTPILILAVYAVSWVVCCWEKIQQRFAQFVKAKFEHPSEDVELEEIV